MSRDHVCQNMHTVIYLLKPDLFLHMQYSKTHIVLYYTLNNSAYLLPRFDFSYGGRSIVILLIDVDICYWLFINANKQYNKWSLVNNTAAREKVPRAKYYTTTHIRLEIFQVSVVYLTKLPYQDNLKVNFCFFIGNAFLQVKSEGVKNFTIG